MGKPLFVFDLQENIVAILQNKDGSKACPYYEAKIVDQLNGEYTFEFMTLAGHRDSQYLIRGNKIGFTDDDGEFLLFDISKTDDSHGEGLLKNVICEHSVVVELNDDIIGDKRPVNVTADAALDIVLTQTTLGGTRWKKGNVAALGTGTPENIFYESPLSGIQKIITAFKTDYKPRVTFKDNKILDRFIDLGPLGTDTGRRFEYTKDMVEIRREVDMTGVKTALIGRGKGEENESETGGDSTYGRRIEFRDVVWSKTSGKPADKPAGQIWVGDPDALAAFGHSNGSGGKRHRLGIFEDTDETDPAILLQKTWDQLQLIKEPMVTYTMTVIDLGRITGLPHQKIKKGDTITVIDREFVPALAIKARVISLNPVIDEPENTEVVLGNFLPLLTDESLRIDELEKTIGDRSGVWETSTGTIKDSNFPDTIPDVPTNVSATGLFQAITVEWDHVVDISIAQYEVYGSKVQGFTPDTAGGSNRLWRGDSGGYVHAAVPNEQWYFRIRAVNRHGNGSAFSSEVSARTTQIIPDDWDQTTIPEFVASGIIKSDTPPTGVKWQTLWIDTSKEPQVMYRWNATRWVRLSATSAADVGAYTITQVDDQMSAKASKAVVDDITERMTAAETEISQNSEEISLRATKVEFDNLNIGTRNILPNSTWNKGNESWTGSLSSTFEILPPEADKPNSSIFKITPTSTSSQKSSHSIPIVPGKEYTVSVDVKLDTYKNNSALLFILRTFPEKDTVNSGANALQTIYVARFSDVLEGGKWQRITYTFTPTAGAWLKAIPYNSDNLGGVPSYFREIKIEEGNKATSWTAAPEDLESRVSLAEASISVQADQIASKVEKNGVISTINQTAETVKISAEKIHIDGDLVVTGGMLRVKTGIITNSLIAANAAIDFAKIANVQITNAMISGKLDANKIEATTAEFTSGTSTRYTKITSGYIETRGAYTRTWRGKTETNDIKLKAENGYYRARNDSLNRSLYFSDFGISTFADGSGDGTASGVIEFFSDEYVDMSAGEGKGVTVASTDGVVAIRSYNDDVVMDGGRDATIFARTGTVKLRPRDTNRVGNNVFQFDVKLNESASDTDGVIYFGSPTATWGSGIRFSKSSSDDMVYITDATGSARTGNLTAKQIIADDRFVGSIETPTENLYLMVNEEVRVTSKSGYNGGNPTYQDLAASNIRSNSMRVNTGTHLYLGIHATNGGEVRVTNSLLANDGNPGYHPIKASEFRLSSSQEYKTNIEPLPDIGLDTINALSVKEYSLVSDIEVGIYNNKQVGLISELSPSVATTDQKAINSYKLIGYNVKATQELSAKAQKLESDNLFLTDTVTALVADIEELRTRIATLEGK
jgi:phage minor structural protein